MAADPALTLSVGQLHSAAQLLEVVAEMKLGTIALASEMHTVLVCPMDDVLNLAIRCAWIVADENGDLALSLRGKEIRAVTDYQPRLLEQLRDCVAILRPSWTRLLPDGQREFARFAPKDIVQCFEEAGAFSRPVPQHLLRWWDDLSDLARGLRAKNWARVGRAAERLTLDYETDRVGCEPVWESVESNFSGYDVRSRISRQDDNVLQIEVKGSEASLKHAVMHLTAWEWSVATGPTAHAFHLWLLGKVPRIAVIDVPSMARHIPKNLGRGQWESAVIPFRAFASGFEDVLSQREAAERGGR